MTDAATLDVRRREILVRTVSFAGVAAAGALVVPFVGSMNPSERAKALGAPIRVDVSGIAAGRQVTVAWRGKPVWILHRTPDMIERLRRRDTLALLVDPQSAVRGQQPESARNLLRSIRSELFVAVSLCTHLGCIPTFRPDPGSAGDASWPGGYFCPCHGSKFDLAGRVFKNVPAPTNLVVPPHRYMGPNTLDIGHDQPIV